VVSFCILRLDGLMITPVAYLGGFGTVSCAYRCGAIDLSEAKPKPSVYIVGRNTDLRIISTFGPTIFKSALPRVYAGINRKGECIDIHTKFLDGKPLFSARVKSSNNPNSSQSRVFSSLDKFVKFIHDGQTSYAPSIKHGAYSRVDLFKDDSDYESMTAVVDHNLLDSLWPDVDLEFDSVFRAGGGGMYRWKYFGLYSDVSHTGDRLISIDPHRSVLNRG
jgi:hypothetical protein